MFSVKHSSMKPNAFLGLVQAFTDKAATTRKTSVLVTHIIHVVLINFPVSFLHWFIEIRHTVVVFMSVGEGCCTLEEEDKANSKRSLSYWFTGT